jgi:hypothetical protein
MKCEMRDEKCAQDFTLKPELRGKMVGLGGRQVEGNIYLFIVYITTLSPILTT